MVVLFLFALIVTFCLYGGTGVAILIGALVLVFLITLVVADYQERSRRKRIEKEGPEIIYPKTNSGTSMLGSDMPRRTAGTSRNESRPMPRMYAQRSASKKAGQHISDTERYIREEERWHAWECPHGDSYECDCE